MGENLYLNREVPECQIANKVNKEGDKRKHRSQKKVLIQANWCVWLSSWRKVTPVSGKAWQTEIFKWTKANWTKTKQKHGVNTMHTKTCVTFDMSFATPQSTALLYFLKKLFYRTQHIMSFRNNSVKQNRFEDQNWKKRWWKRHMFKCCYEP